MPKILKPYTIIPPDLYIQRDADKQVKNIISDMGRPGYVLVSRQMGKTNLLLNAKRKLETPNDAFVYIDLSNIFEDAKSCFENIIDIAIDTYPEKFDRVKESIKERRNELTNTPPHKQHTNELRILLAALNGGKLVIILDEIDALTKTNYSDQIFSQIRSSYFASRVNYKEFYNLTYLLSGVVEPSEIIKDPKVSPFNIGQKIYLNDFSKTEFENFINVSQLSLDQKLKDRIFYWTNGNPRITWDLCSEIENEIKRNVVTVDLLDKIVKDLYLTTFDKPPIDNIRDLVIKDREIRNSIVEIGYKKGNEISDKIKSKLYLSGIINFNESSISIKNEIIKQSLSLEWIRSIEEEERGLIKIALDYFEKGQYLESIETFERYLKENDFDKKDKSIFYHYLGIAYFETKQFELAIENLNKTSFDVNDEAKFYYSTLNYLGTAYYNLNKIPESLEHLRIIIDSGRNDIEYTRALINYGITLLKSSEQKDYTEALEIFKGIITETGLNKEKLEESYIAEIKAISYYNTAQILSINGELEEALKNYRHAIHLSSPNKKPKIILDFLRINKNESENFKILDELIETIIERKITPSVNEITSYFTIDDLKNIIIYCFNFFEDTLFVKLKSHFSILGDKSIAKHLFDLALFSINANKNWKIGEKFLEKIYANKNNSDYAIDSETKYETLKLIAYLSNVKDNQDRYTEYLDLFATERFGLVDYLDMEIFANLIFALTGKKKYSEALRYVNLINSVKDSVPEGILINYLVIYNLEINLYFYLNERQKAIKKAEEIIELADNEKIKNQNSNLLGETGLEIIRQNAEQILYPTLQKKEPIKTGKVYGRNDIVKVRYKDGTTIEVKFKKIENDLRSEKCFILNKE
jgi:hypothetical protein